MSQERKNYKLIFGNLLWIGVLVNIVAKINLDKDFYSPKFATPLLLVALLFLTVLWMIYLNKAWTSIGKKYGWAIGLITLIPIGPFIAYSIAFNYLKKTDFWSGKNECQLIVENNKKNVDFSWLKEKINNYRLVVLLVIFFVAMMSFFIYVDQMNDVYTNIAVSFLFAFIFAVIANQLMEINKNNDSKN